MLYELADASYVFQDFMNEIILQQLTAALSQPKK